MNRVFEYKNGMIKIIWNEIPMSVDYESICLSKEIQKKTYALKTSFLIGVELQISTGGRVCYGMLGAQVQPYDKNDTIKLSIQYTHKNTVKYDKSFLFDDEFVYKGLPEEYIDYMCNSIYETFITKTTYPNCEINFEYAANCEIGSSPMIFGVIAEMIINLIDTSSIEDFYYISLGEFAQKYAKKINLHN